MIQRRKAAAVQDLPIQRTLLSLLALATALLLPTGGQAAFADRQSHSSEAVRADVMPPEYADYLVLHRSEGPDGGTTYQLQAQYKGVPVHGSYVRLEKKAGAAAFEEAIAEGDTPDLGGVNTTPTIGADEAIAAMQSDLARELGAPTGVNPSDGDVPVPEASLVVYPFKGHAYLAYEVQLRFTTPVVGDWVGYVDAATGRIIDRYNRLSAAVAAPPIGYGKGRSGVLQSFYVKPRTEAGKTVYQLLDATRPTIIQTFDFRKPSSRKDLPEGFDYVTSGSKTFADAAAVDAHVNAKRVYLFYKNKYRRNGIDDKNMAIRSFVHVGSSAQTRNNAFWSGRAMYYGDGTGLKNGGVNCTSCAYDLVAHELTHGVTQYTVGLEYRGQSGSLNEAISDIMAAVMEADDWEIGEDTGAAVRSLSDPGKYGQPAHMNDYVNLPVDEQHDNGGVHINSGIPAHAAYLTALKIDNADIGLGGRDTLGRLTYVMLRDRLIPPTADFYDAREGYIAAAGCLTGVTAAQKGVIAQKIKDAWDAVGIGEQQAG